VQLAATKLRFEHAIFLLKVRDDLLVVALHPPGDHHDEHA